MILGLDFGTSTTSVSTLDVTGEQSLLKIGLEGHTSIPSVIGLDSHGVMQYGQQAINLYAAGEIERLERSLKNSITDNPKSLVISAGDHNLDLFLRFVVQRVLDVSGLDLINDSDIEVRVSSPAGWDWQQRTRLLRILSKNIGIRVANQAVVDEPSSAALTSIHLFQDDNPHRVLIFDMGGGTLDLAVMHVDPATSVPTILAADSQPLAGNKLDSLLTGCVLEKALEELRVPLDYSHRESNEAMGALLLEALGLEAPLKQFLSYLEIRVESIKRNDLAQDQDAYIRHFLSFLTARFGPIATNHPDFDIEITGSEFQAVLYSFLSDAKSWIAKVIQYSNFNGKNLDKLGEIRKDTAPDQITDVVLAGGMAHVYALRDWVDDMFPKKRVSSFEVEPEDLVAVGLAPRSITETEFGARSNFRPNFNLFLGENLILRAYTPLFEIQQGSTDGTFYKYIPSKEDWSNSEIPARFEKHSLLGQKISEVPSPVFHPGDLSRLFRDGFVIYPSGGLVCPDGDGCNLQAFIFDDSEPEPNFDSRSKEQFCTFCGMKTCPGLCQN